MKSKPAHKRTRLASALLVLAGLTLLCLTQRPKSAHDVLLRSPQVEARQLSPGADEKPEPHRPTQITARKLTDAEVITAAVNDVTESAPGVVEHTHPLHRSTLTAEDGLTFMPNRSASHWRWQLRHFGGEGQSWIKSRWRKVAATRFGQHSFGFDYGLFVERYVPREKTLEQQFVILKKPHLPAGEDLVIRGEIDAGGAGFEEHEAGWVWRDPATGRVTSLGDVHVYDAGGEALPAEMRVEKNQTTIRVDGEALLAAAYPVTVDPEIGTDDFAIAYQAFPDIQEYEAVNPRVSYSPEEGLALAVWKGIDETGRTGILADYYIHSDRKIADGGSKLLSEIPRISSAPAIAYDSSSQNHVVVWCGGLEGYAENHAEVFAKLANSRGESHSDQLQLSFTGLPTVDPGGAATVEVAATGTGQALVVWATKENATHDLRSTVHARMIDMLTGDFASGLLVLNDPAFGFESSQLEVAYNPIDREFLVVWNRFETESDEHEIRARRIELASGSATVSNAPATIVGRTRFSLYGIGLAFNSRSAHYLATWSSDDSDGLLGQALDREGNEIGGNDFPIVVRTDDVVYSGSVHYDEASDSYLIAHFDNESQGHVLARLPGSEPSSSEPVRTLFAPTRNLGYPGAALVPVGGGRFLCVYEDAEARPLHDRSSEVFYQLLELDPRGALRTIDGPHLVSHTPLPDPSGTFQAFRPEVAYVEAVDAYTVVWSGHTNVESPGSEVGEFEIFARGVSGDGHPFGRPVQVTHLGTAGNRSVRAIRPRVAAGGSASDVLIVFEGIGNLPAAGKTEVYGVFIRWWGLAERSAFRITFTGSEDEPRFHATEPDVAWEPRRNRFLVVWKQDGTSPDLDDHFVIRGAFVRRSGGRAEIEDRVLISPALSAGEDASPRVVHNGRDNFLVAYAGAYDLGSGPQSGIWLREIDHTGTVTSVFEQVSDHPVASQPDLAVNPARDEFCVVWQGGLGGSLPARIHGQRMKVRPVGKRGGPFQISRLAFSVATDTGVHTPRISYVPDSRSYLVVWSGRELRTGRNLNGQRLAFSQRLDEDGTMPSSNIQLSGNASSPEYVSVASGADGNSLVVWHGTHENDTFRSTFDDIYGQLYRFEEALQAEVSIRDNDVRIDLLHAEAGGKYLFQATSDLENWTLLNFGVVAQKAGRLRFVDEGAITEFAKRFYRVLRAAN